MKILFDGMLNFIGDLISLSFDNDGELKIIIRLM